MPFSNVMKIDSHTHTSHSHDGRQSMSALFARAKELNLGYLAVTEHLDLEGAFVCERPLDLDAYHEEFFRLKQQFDLPQVAFGCEMGFAQNAGDNYLNCKYLHKFDVIINSVHYVEGEDPYFPVFFETRGKALAYEKYFMAVRNSLEVQYPYQIVGHIGYMMRYAPFENRAPEGRAAEIVEDIFKRAIELDKTVEINIHTKKTGLLATPTESMMRRYREMGGDNITFGSDAHQTERLCEKYDQTAQWLKALGFRYYTVYMEQKPIKIKI